MKKFLIGTTALLAAGAFVSTAQASDPIKLSLGGYMEYWVAGASQDGDYRDGNRVNNFDVQGESEIHFKGKTTLDNGMTIGVQVELEAGSNNNGTDTVDESYMWLSGKYGKLIVGSENDVTYLSHVGAPEASQMGIGIAESDTNKYLLVPVAYLEPIMGGETTGDANKLSYFTPKYYGFQAGVSYTPSNTTAGDDASATSETIAKAISIDDTWGVSLAYSNTFSGVGVKAQAGYAISDDNGTTARTTLPGQDGEIQDFGGGLSLSYMGFTLGGSARRLVSNVNTSLASRDGVAWDAGLQYAEGPYAVSLSYTRSDVVSARGNAVTTNDNDTVDLWKVGANYKLGAGVDLFGQLAYLDAQDEDATNSAAARQKSNDGAFGGVVGLKLNF
ncbi:MAG: porin [Rhodospirillaceae bacterium]|nr:porin [Rhodospirillaceae bacterium]